MSDEDLEGGKAAGGEPVTSQPPPSTNPFRYAGGTVVTKGRAGDGNCVDMGTGRGRSLSEDVIE